MTNDHEPDVGQLWRQQSQTGHSLSLDEIRMKARDLDAKVRQWNLVGGLMCALLLVKNAW
jgi:hypothetical protein